MSSTAASRGEEEGVVSKALYSVGALATALETAPPDFLRRRFGLRVLLAGPLCSVIGFPFAAAYLIENAPLSFVVAGGGVAVTGFMVYAEMHWLLRKPNRKAVEIEGGTHDLSFDYERPKRSPGAYRRSQRWPGSRLRAPADASDVSERPRE